MSVQILSSWFLGGSIAAEVLATGLLIAGVTYALIFIIYYNPFTGNNCPARTIRLAKTFLVLFFLVWVMGLALKGGLYVIRDRAYASSFTQPRN